MKLFKKNEQLDILQEKELEVTKINSDSESSLNIISSCVDDLENVNRNIERSLVEVNEYFKRLEDVRSDLQLRHDANEKIMKKFLALLSAD